MAIVDNKSQIVTDLDATPVVKQNPVKVGGTVRAAVGHVVTGTADSIASIYRLARIPSRARIIQVLLDSDAGSTAAAAADFGLYDDTDNGSAVVDVNFFATAVVLGTAATGTDITYEAGTTPSAILKNSPLWEQLGLASDPEVMYDIAATLTVANSVAATTFGIRVLYVMPD